MSNESGTNQFAGFGAEPPYGASTARDRLVREAPMSGASIVNAPRRSQRRATRGAQAQAQPEAAAPALPATPEPSYAAQLASVWRAAADTPGASPLVQDYADAAQRAVR